MVEVEGSAAEMSSSVSDSPSFVRLLALAFSKWILLLDFGGILIQKTSSGNEFSSLVLTLGKINDMHVAGCALIRNTQRKL